MPDHIQTPLDEALNDATHGKGGGVEKTFNTISEKTPESLSQDKDSDDALEEFNNDAEYVKGHPVIRTGKYNAGSLKKLCIILLPDY